MGVFKINGTNILDLAEVVETSDGRQKSTAFSSGKLDVTGLSDSGKTLANAPSGYVYTKNIVGNKLKVNGVADTVSMVGYRPNWNTPLVNSLTPGYYYFNWFADGEVYWSTTAGSRTGGKISSTIQKRRSFFFILTGSGGGGGSGGGAGSSNVANGGGSGGLVVGNVTLQPNTSNNFLVRVGTGGGGGTSRAGGGGGSSSEIALNSVLVAGAGTGGGGAGNSKVGGAGGFSYENQTVHNATFTYLQGWNGVAGGLRGTTSAPSTARSANKYVPEGGTIQAGGSTSNNGRTGSGTASGCGGCGYNGKGGYSVGDGQNGNNGYTSGGGSGSGCGFAFTGTGGSGAAGYVRIYY